MVIQKRTRQQIRQSIGYNLGAMRTGTASGTGSTTTIIDAAFFEGSDDNYNGKFAVVADITDSNNTEIRRISDYTSSSTTATLQSALSFATASGDTYEIWDREYNPTAIHEFINQAILDVTGQIYDPMESDDLHTDGKTARFDAPSNFSMINKVQYRSEFTWTSLHQCNAAFDGAAVSNFTSAVDTQDKKQNTSSVKFTLNDAAGVSAGAILTADISSKDISKYDYLECWVKSSIDTSAGNLKISLDNTANCVSPLETLSIPALTEDTWTYVRMQLSTPELDTAIISIGLEQDADIGGGAAYYVWLDDIKVVQNDSATWTDVPSNLWSIDKVAEDIVFNRDGVQLTGYHLLKVKGGDKPALLTSDTATCEVDDGYVINKATALALSAQSGGPATDPDSRRQQAAFYYGMSEQNKRAFPFLVNVRTIS